MRICCIIASLFLSLTSFAGRFIQCDVEDNALASKLFGSWQFDPESSVMSGDKDVPEKVTITSDVSVFSAFAQHQHKFKEDLCVYEAGLIEIQMTQGKTFSNMPFVLSVIEGVPAILHLYKNCEGTLKSKIYSVSLMSDSDRGQDRLIIGEDLDDPTKNTTSFKRMAE